jgi:hypothetical protein
MLANGMLEYHVVIAATFGAVWLHHKTGAIDWVKYPAVGLCVIAVLSLIS